LKLSTPYYFFVPKDFRLKKEYENGFRITDIMPIYNSGIKTDRDTLFIDNDKKILKNRIKNLLSTQFSDDFREKFRIYDSGSYKITRIIKDRQYSDAYLQRIQYRPFDERWLYYDPVVISRPAEKVTKHFIRNDNLGLIFLRTMPAFEKWSGIFITDKPIEFGIGGSFPGNSAPMAPLYLYPDTDTFAGEQTRKPNLDDKIVTQIAESVKLKYESEKSGDPKKFAPIDLLDYIYAVLHSPKYRERYKEFLKIDFPRVPYPKDAKSFRKLAKLGEKLRKLHLMEGVEPKPGLADYGVSGDNKVESIRYANGKVWINDAQFFNRVPMDVWDFYIGGYQPAQKWLQDRKGRSLSVDDIEHYQKIVRVLKETMEVVSG
jgi:predicted helicase